MRANPFETAPPAFLRATFDLLLRGGFTRDQLRAHLVASQGWSEGTALSHVGIAIGVLLATGAAEEHAERITLIDKGPSA